MWLPTFSLGGNAFSAHFWSSELSELARQQHHRKIGSKSANILRWSQEFMYLKKEEIDQTNAKSIDSTLEILDSLHPSSKLLDMP